MIRHEHESSRFSNRSIILHWGIAVTLMASMMIQYDAVYFAQEPLKTVLFMLHRSLGAMAFFLSFFFILLKFIDKRPPVIGMPRAVRGVYKIVHSCLFLLPIFLFLSGWLIYDLKDKEFYFFGHLIQAPDLFAKNILGSIEARFHHKLLSALAVLMIVGHSGAALVHHFIMKDEVMWRMWPGDIFLPKTKK